MISEVLKRQRPAGGSAKIFLKFVKTLLFHAKEGA